MWDIEHGTAAAVTPVAYRSILGGAGRTVKVEDGRDVPFDFATRDKLLRVLRNILEARKLPWVAGRDYSIVFSNFHGARARGGESRGGGGLLAKRFAASVVCKCGTALKLWYSHHTEDNSTGNYMRHLDRACKAVHNTS